MIIYTVEANERFYEAFLDETSIITDYLSRKWRYYPTAGVPFPRGQLMIVNVLLSRLNFKHFISVKALFERLIRMQYYVVNAHTLRHRNTIWVWS